jgi:prepilin-type N-terminal cleavage/methylation domain-containing protein
VRVNKSQSGFSTIELLVVIVIIAIISAVAVLGFGTAMRSAHENAAVQLTLKQLRMARQEAVDRRMQYTVTFTLPGTIRTARTTGLNPLPGVVPPPPVVTTIERTVTLPSDVQFTVPAGVPAQAPDNFGAAAFPIDFDQATGGGGNTLVFLPDGTAQDNLGNPNNGVIYIARPGDLNSAHAISVWGATGRFKLWTVNKNKLGLLEWM